MIIVLELYRILCQLCCCFSSIFFVWNYGFTLNYYLLLLLLLLLLLFYTIIIFSPLHLCYFLFRGDIKLEAITPPR